MTSVGGAPAAGCNHQWKGFVTLGGLDLVTGPTLGIYNVRGTASGTVNAL